MGTIPLTGLLLPALLIGGCELSSRTDKPAPPLTLVAGVAQIPASGELTLAPGATGTLAVQALTAEGGGVDGVDVVFAASAGLTVSAGDGAVAGRTTTKLVEVAGVAGPGVAAIQVTVGAGAEVGDVGYVWLALAGTVPPEPPPLGAGVIAVGDAAAPAGDTAQSAAASDDAAPDDAASDDAASDDAAPDDAASDDAAPDDAASDDAASDDAAPDDAAPSDVTEDAGGEPDAGGEIGPIEDIWTARVFTVRVVEAQQ